MATTTSLVLVSVILFSAGWLSPPENILKALAGWMFLGWFGAGLALTIAGLSERFQIVQQLWRPISYILMPVSGVAFVVDALPPGIQAIVDRAHDRLKGTNGTLTGVTAVDRDFIHALFRSFPYVLALLLVLTLILLARAFRSIVLALKAVVLNLISLAATFGVVRVPVTV